MTSACGAVTTEELVAYWANDLAPADVDRLDEHLMGCAACHAASLRISAVTKAVRALIPLFLTRGMLESLRAQGHRIRENVVSPEDRRTVVFDAATDLLIHTLTGLDLAAATNVGVVVSVEETGAVLHEEPSVPFDRDSGEVLVACQPHFAALPPDIVFTVRLRDAAGSERVTRYPVPHRFDERGGG